MSDISIALEAYTAKNSSFETSRDYVSISHCYDSVEQMIQTYIHGFEDSLDIRLRCYTGYKCEHDMMNRIKATFGSRITQGGEISLYDGLVKGHPDFQFDAFPGDCKTVPLDEHLPDGRMPNRVFWQMQGYMLYMDKNKALVIYESKATGKIRDFWVPSNRTIQSQINDKFKAVVQAIKSTQRQTA